MNSGGRLRSLELEDIFIQYKQYKKVSQVALHYRFDMEGSERQKIAFEAQIVEELGERLCCSQHYF